MWTLPLAAAARPRPDGRSLRQARRALLEAGAPPSGLLDAAVEASWQRSLAHGLEPQGRSAGVPHASAAQLRRAQEQRRQLLAQARPVMEFVHDQIRDAGQIVMLADAEGMLLEALGDTGFADKAARVALRPGANWLEQWRGTNAIGTALAEGRPLMVHGGEHFLERNGFLTCAATPIWGPDGRLLGVLDISGDQRGEHRHALGLVRAAGRMLEHQLFEARHGAGLRLRLHGRPEGLGTVVEGLLALDEDGRILGANRTALELLRLPASAVGQWQLDAVMEQAVAALRQRGGPQAVEGTAAGTLWARLDGARRGPSAAPVPAQVKLPAPRDALQQLDSGDAALAQQIARARRVLDKPIPLLLQGESGVGKELFARACHDSGPRAARPFVAVNCAALPESLIEAELFGYRGGAFTGARREGAPGRLREAAGGTLFLDEIGDMPLALQARLLRVLQERQVQPLGGGAPVDLDFALIAASHRPLRELVQQGRFREDLYYRLNGLMLRLPPLRERSDLAGLIAQLLHDLAPGRPLTLAPALAQAFAAHAWPGNVRQLAQVLRTAVALLDDDETQIVQAHLPEDLLDDLMLQAASAPLETEDLRTLASQRMQQMLRDCHGNVSEAARRLGVSRNTLYRRLR
ncbi:sigma-54-dependent Fis family transcriptional regulator [Roseateles microcysteis]|uniref:sigma-54-dependent Fis family transcriptional regulator n=1 Tax=Roseateles microcysteis TaxID=3119057 RepID=UPI002FE6A9B3